MKMRSKQALVALIVFVSVIVGLVIHTGTGTLCALGWRDIALICPVGVLETLAGSKSLLLHPLILLAVAVLIAFFAGRAFCGWACPVPHVENFFHPKRSKHTQHDAGAAGKGNPEKSAPSDSERPAPAETAAIMQDDWSNRSPEPLPPVGGERDGRHVDSRHLVLAGAIASSFAFGFPVFCLVCPVGLSFAVTIAVWNLLRFNEASWGLIVFPLIMMAEIVLFRRWCHTFCPIGALLSLVAGRTTILRPIVERSTCLRTTGTDCRSCVSVCPEKVDPHAPSIPECSRCGLCVEACPSKAIRISPFGKTTDRGKSTGPSASETKR